MYNVQYITNKDDDYMVLQQLIDLNTTSLNIPRGEVYARDIEISNQEEIVLSARFIANEFRVADGNPFALEHLKKSSTYKRAYSVVGKFIEEVESIKQAKKLAYDTKRENFKRLLDKDLPAFMNNAKVLKASRLLETEARKLNKKLSESMTSSFGNLMEFREVMGEQLPSESSRNIIINAVDGVINEGKI